MSPGADRLDDLIQSVADGEPVDWHAVEASLEGSGEAARQRWVRHLRLVAGIAEVHRTAVSDDAVDPAVPETVVLNDKSAAPGGELGRWGKFVLLNLIGEGSYGVVYRARDPWLDREVALKLMKPEALSRVAPERILTEARTLARLRHPGVVAVYGADTHDGRVGLWMELVQGRTLGHLLAANGTFSAQETVAIGRELCHALAAVHAKGVVHQDVKAQNVMREAGGRLVLMDFGAGGTPLYLAPEVLAGGKPTFSSDVYAVGVLLFHLVTARYPVSGANVYDLERAHNAGRRLRLTEARSELPDAFVAVVERAISPVASDRYATVTALREALGAVGAAPAVTPVPAAPQSWWRTVGVAAMLALSAAALLGTLWGRGDPPPPSTASSVAVLPFDALGGDAETAIYSDGLAADLSSQLATLASVQVVSAGPRRAADMAATPVDIGRRLGVGTLVSGQVRLADQTIRVGVEVVDVRTARSLWARSFERPRRELAALQAEVTERVAEAVKGTLSGADMARLERHTPDPRAFELYLRGRYYWNTRTPEGLRRSIRYFNDAIAVDPRSALPHSGLADAYMLAAFYYVEPVREAHARGEAAAEEALRLEPDLAQAHAALGALRLTQFRWDEAASSLGRAIELNPSYASAHHWRAILLTQQRRFDEALAAMQAARAADPFSHVLRDAIAYILYAARDYDAALREYQQVLDVDPADYQALAGLVETHAARGDLPAALAALDEARRRTGRANDLSLQAAYVYALAGRRDDALTEVKAVEARGETAPTGLADMACVYGVLNDRETAFFWLARAAERGDTQLGYLGVDPRFDRLRADKRFDALLSNLGLSPQGAR